MTGLDVQPPSDGGLNPSRAAELGLWGTTKRVIPNGGGMWKKGEPDPEWVERSPIGRFEAAPSIRAVTPIESRATTGRAGAERLTTEDAVTSMVADGFPEAQVRWLAELGVMYRSTGPSGNPVYGHIASPDAMIGGKVDPVAQEIADQEDLIARIEGPLEVARRQGVPEESLEYTKQRLERALAGRTELTQRMEMQFAEAVARFGTGGIDTLGAEMDDLMAEAFQLFEGNLPRMPAWKRERDDGTPTPFMIMFNEGMLVEDEAGNLVHGMASTGQNTIYFNRGTFRTPISDTAQRSVMPTDATTLGEYASLHEPGHLVDTANHVDEWSSMNPANKAPWLASRVLGGMTGYGGKSPREGYAEAYTAWLADPTNPSARIYAEWFGWDDPARPETRETGTALETTLDGVFDMLRADNSDESYEEARRIILNHLGVGEPAGRAPEEELGAVGPVGAADILGMVPEPPPRGAAGLELRGMAAELYEEYILQGKNLDPEAAEAFIARLMPYHHYPEINRLIEALRKVGR